MPVVVSGESDRNAPIALPQSLPYLNRLGRLHGEFYLGILDTVLSDAPPEGKQAQIRQQIGSVPAPMRTVYSEGFSRLTERMGENASIIRAHQGGEAAFLLGYLARAQGKTEDDVAQIMAGISMASYHEPYPGVPVVEVKTPLYEGTLAKIGVVPPSAPHIAVIGDEGEPSFLLMRQDLINRPANRSSVKHELHHLMWEFLDRSGFLRQVNEESPERAAGFSRFRSEFAAYIISEEDMMDKSPKVLVYSDDPEVLSLAVQTRDYAGLCMKMARRKGIPPTDFMYAAVSSRSFEELRQTCARLTPLTMTDDRPCADDDVIEVLFKNRNRPGIADVQRQLVADTGMVASAESLGEYPNQLVRDGLSRRQSKPMIRKDIDDFAVFCQEVFHQTIDKQRIIQRWGPILSER
ncbi:Uncharacterised protein [uncultured archaeon]|nr:Uncharacterised protein [uncultured archaeon]